MDRGRKSCYSWERTILWEAPSNPRLGKDEVRVLVKELCESSRFGHPGAVSVHFYSRSVGRMGFAKPSEIHLNIGRGFVRKSTVLHEYAHLIVEKDVPGMGHGPEFVTVLAQLYSKYLRLTESKILDLARDKGLLEPPLGLLIEKFKRNVPLAEKERLSVHPDDIENFELLLKSLDTDEYSHGSLLDKSSGQLLFVRVPGSFDARKVSRGQLIGTLKQSKPDGAWSGRFREVVLNQLEVLELD